MTWISKEEQWPPVGDRGVTLKFNRGGIVWTRTNCVFDRGVPISYDCNLKWNDDLCGSVDEVTHWEDPYDLGGAWTNVFRALPEDGTRIDVRFSIHRPNDDTAKEKVLFGCIYAFGRAFWGPGREVNLLKSTRDNTPTHWRYTVVQ